VILPRGKAPAASGGDGATAEWRDGGAPELGDEGGIAARVWACRVRGGGCGLMRARVLAGATYEGVMALVCGPGVAPRSDSGSNPSLARGKERGRRAGPA
jgi:hypothetical protein